MDGFLIFWRKVGEYENLWSAFAPEGLLNGAAIFDKNGKSSHFCRTKYEESAVQFARFDLSFLSLYGNL